MPHRFRIRSSRAQSSRSFPHTSAHAHVCQGCCRAHSTHITRCHIRRSRQPSFSSHFLPRPFSIPILPTAIYSVTLSCSLRRSSILRILLAFLLLRFYVIHDFNFQKSYKINCNLSQQRQKPSHNFLVSLAQIRDYNFVILFFVDEILRLKSFETR